MSFFEWRVSVEVRCRRAETADVPWAELRPEFSFVPSSEATIDRVVAAIREQHPDVIETRWNWTRFEAGALARLTGE